MLSVRVGRGRPLRRLRHRDGPPDDRRSLAEEGDADDADVAIAVLAGRERVPHGREPERRHRVERGAPAVDGDVGEGRDDVAALHEARRAPVDRVQAVDRDDGLDPRRGRVHDADPVTLAGLAEDEAPGPVGERRQRLRRVADKLDVGDGRARGAVVDDARRARGDRAGDGVRVGALHAGGGQAGQRDEDGQGDARSGSVGHADPTRQPSIRSIVSRVTRARDVLGPGSPLSRALEGWEHREGQLAMAEAVEAALEGERHLFVEAGTGTGKTLAYLVPAVLSGRKVVISTATRALQEQIFVKDLPIVADALAAHGIQFRAALMKGLANYVCLRRLGEAQLSGQHGADPAFARIVDWARHTETGDRAELTDLREDAEAWREVALVERDADRRLVRALRRVLRDPHAARGRGRADHRRESPPAARRPGAADGNRAGRTPRFFPPTTRSSSTRRTRWRTSRRTSSGCACRARASTRSFATPSGRSHP